MLFMVILLMNVLQKGLLNNLVYHSSSLRMERRATGLFWVIPSLFSSVQLGCKPLDDEDRVSLNTWSLAASDKANKIEKHHEEEEKNEILIGEIGPWKTTLTSALTNFRQLILVSKKELNLTR